MLLFTSGGMVSSAVGVLIKIYGQLIKNLLLLYIRSYIYSCIYVCQ
jgi:hypothetical protein